MPTWSPKVVQRGGVSDTPGRGACMSHEMEGQSGPMRTKIIKHGRPKRRPPTSSPPRPKKMYELKSNLRTPPIVSRPECLPELPGAVTAAAATKQRMFISKIYGCLTSIRFGGHQRGNKRGCDLMIQSFEGRDPRAVCTS